MMILSLHLDLGAGNGQLISGVSPYTVYALEGFVLVVIWLVRQFGLRLQLYCLRLTSGKQRMKWIRRFQLQESTQRV